jgi:hypothetical protein
MEFRIQYFGSHDRFLYAEQIDAEELAIALDRARDMLKEPTVVSAADPSFLGYVILDRQGRLVARGYRRDGAAG